jgi:hypothetical protein
MTTSGNRFQEDDSPRLSWKFTLFGDCAVATAMVWPMVLVVAIVGGAWLARIVPRKLGVM